MDAGGANPWSRSPEEWAGVPHEGRHPAGGERCRVCGGGARCRFSVRTATALGVLGGRLANNLPSGFVQRGTGSVESDDGHDGDLQKGTGVSPPGEETPAGG